MRTKSELQTFENEFLLKIREKEAWKNISENEDLPWGIAFIDKYADNLDWEELCQNRGIIWTIDLIEKFKYLIEWDILSEFILSRHRGFYSQEIDWNIFEKFDRYWNWHALSKASCYIPTNIVEKYAENWDWRELINNDKINWTDDLFEKFKQYIPIIDFEKLKRSSLWKQLIKTDEQILTGKILADR
jgi:hypothetical protein